MTFLCVEVSRAVNARIWMYNGTSLDMHKVGKKAPWCSGIDNVRLLTNFHGERRWLLPLGIETADVCGAHK
jgi:hypothetical protein